MEDTAGISFKGRGGVHSVNAGVRSPHQNTQKLADSLIGVGSTRSGESVRTHEGLVTMLQPQS
jgi:hypothetical protein